METIEFGADSIGGNAVQGSDLEEVRVSEKTVGSTPARPTIEERISGKNSDQIANIQTEIEKELNDYEASNDLIENEISSLGREILAKRSRIKELEDTLRQGRKLVREKKFDFGFCKREFWRTKDGR